jgi:hypothetical protein
MVDRLPRLNPHAKPALTWIRCPGAPTTLNKWLSGTSEVGLAPPVGPTVTHQNLEGYLQANTYFQLHPKNFVHMQEAVTAALGLLPNA